MSCKDRGWGTTVDLGRWGGYVIITISTSLRSCYTLLRYGTVYCGVRARA